MPGRAAGSPPKLCSAARVVEAEDPHSRLMASDAATGTGVLAEPVRGPDAQHETGTAQPWPMTAYPAGMHLQACPAEKLRPGRPLRLAPLHGHESQVALAREGGSSPSLTADPYEAGRRAAGEARAALGDVPPS